jgi:hypothetical protein
MTTVLGSRGICMDTCQALEKLVQTGDINLAVMTDIGTPFDVRHHGFLVVLQSGKIEIVADAFTSGYVGGGVEALMAAIRLLQGYEVPLNWIAVDGDTFEDLYDGLLPADALQGLVDSSAAMNVKTVVRKPKKKDQDRAFATFDPEAGTLKMMM